MKQNESRLPGADLVVRCLTCRNTYEVENVTVLMDAVLDLDTDEFVQYDVQFEHDDGEEAYIQDPLCYENRCSVFGRMPDGGVFAFPCLTMSSRPGATKWMSKPDSKNAHFAMRAPKKIDSA